MYPALLAGSSSVPGSPPSDWFCWLTEPTLKNDIFLEISQDRIRFISFIGRRI